jgi:hypothetical protein
MKRPTPAIQPAYRPRICAPDVSSSTPVVGLPVSSRMVLVADWFVRRRRPQIVSPGCHTWRSGSVDNVRSGRASGSWGARLDRMLPSFTCRILPGQLVSRAGERDRFSVSPPRGRRALRVELRHPRRPLGSARSQASRSRRQGTGGRSRDSSSSRPPLGCRLCALLLGTRGSPAPTPSPNFKSWNRQAGADASRPLVLVTSAGG